MKIQKILAPTDLSELSVEGLRYGLKAAQSEGAELLVYHVIGPSEEWLARHEEMFTMKQVVENRRRVLAQFVKLALGNLPAGLPVRAEVDLGVPYRKIIEKAEAEKADLIIMSTHGWSGLLHFLIGSVTEKVVNRAACPVLSIHPLESASLPPASAS
ncbi:MAG TPA: universal stress protein [Verrucomicrobiae bacterium]|jgi:universal stress protein A|nr:universal stress protein [Verrucomicrobiae bacterium]